MTLRRSKRSLAALAEAMALEPDSRAVLEKNQDLEFSGLADLDTAGPESLVFVGSATYVRQMEASRARVFVIDRSLRAQVDAFAKPERIFLFVNDSKVALAKISRFFDLETVRSAGVDSTAKIDSSVKLGSGVAIGPYVEIGAGSVIGDNVVIDGGVKIGANVKIGAESRFFPNVVIYDRIEIGQRCRVHANVVIGSDGFGYAQERVPQGVIHQKIFHLGTVRIGNDVEIGSGTTIDRGTISDTVIGNGVKIDNQVQVGHNCQLGDGVIICGKAGLSGSVKVGKFAILAGMCAAANGAEIGAGAIVGGMAGVQGTVAPGQVVAGNPARSKNEFFRIQGALSSLPEMFKAFRKQHKVPSREEEK